MSLHGKIRCADCGHEQYWHTGTHLKGSKTACRQRGGPDDDRCTCQRFRDPLETGGKTVVTSGNDEATPPRRGFIIDNGKEGQA